MDWKVTWHLKEIEGAEWEEDFGSEEKAREWIDKLRRGGRAHTIILSYTGGPKSEE